MLAPFILEGPPSVLFRFRTGTRYTRLYFAKGLKLLVGTKATSPVMSGSETYAGIAVAFTCISCSEMCGAI